MKFLVKQLLVLILVAVISRDRDVPHTQASVVVFLLLFLYVIQCCTNEYEGMRASDKAFSLNQNKTAPIVLYQ